MIGGRRAGNYADNPAASSYLQEVAQRDYHETVPIDPCKKLDKEYPGWRDPGSQNRKITMVPIVFNDKATKNARNGRDAERKLFKTLQQSNDASTQSAPEPGLDSNKFIFHGQKYGGTEIDFISIDRTGVTVYECKGITVAKQAQGKYRDASTQMNKSIPKLGLGIPVNRVVAFPLCKRTDIEKDGNVQVMFEEDCQNPDSFNKWLSQCFKEKYFSDITLEFDQYVEVVQKFLLAYHAGGNFSDFKTRGISNTADRLQKATKTAIDKFYTKEQAAVLQTCRLFKNMWIQGFAGSGKTFLLIEASKRLAQYDKENKGNTSILVLTYNVPINEEIKLLLKEYIDEKLIRVQTFRGILKHILFFESVKAKDHSPDCSLVQHILSKPGILGRYFKRPGMHKYRHILIDECQDLSGEWLTLMGNLLNRRELSNIWIFSDPYQMVRRGTEMPKEIELEHFEKCPMTKIVRNTHEVFEAYQHCFNTQLQPYSKPIVDHDVYGLAPEYIPVESDEALLQQVVLKLTELQLQKRVSLLHIAIITAGHGTTCSQLPWADRLRHFLTENDVPCTDATKGTQIRHQKRKRDDQPVIVDSVQRFKGLEAKVLIFCIVGGWRPRDEDIYVAFSRSFCHLIVFGKTRMLQEIQRKQAKKQESEHALY